MLPEKKQKQKKTHIEFLNRIAVKWIWNKRRPLCLGLEMWMYDTYIDI